MINADAVVGFNFGRPRGGCGALISTLSDRKISTGSFSKF